MKESPVFYRLRDMGFFAGKVVEVLSNHGPILVKVDDQKLAIGKEMAMKIMVRSLE
ncbi:MAG: ferrous iron transport protein A [Deltaproteobacteria bacterium]|nr:ferrous iron transport protein A [Deltaproteobacteria bacterium]